MHRTSPSDTDPDWLFFFPFQNQRQNVPNLSLFLRNCDGEYNDSKCPRAQQIQSNHPVHSMDSNCIYFGINGTINYSVDYKCVTRYAAVSPKKLLLLIYWIFTTTSKIVLFLRGILINVLREHFKLSTNPPLTIILPSLMSCNMFGPSKWCQSKVFRHTFNKDIKDNLFLELNLSEYCKEPYGSKKGFKPRTLGLTKNPLFNLIRSFVCII